MLKEKAMKAVAKLGYLSAKKASGTASQYGIHQAVEPKKVAELKK